MAIFLRQSTASQEVPLGYFVDSTNGDTEETALTIANTDIKVWKTGATTLANKNSGGATHISNGVYYAVLDATDTDTIGPLVLFVHVSGALAVRVECCVLDEAVYDVLFGTSALTTGGAITVTSGRVNADVTHIATAAVSTSSAQLGVNVVNAAGTAWGSGAITAASIASDAITAAKIANGAIDAATFAADVDAEILSYIVDDATRIDASALNTLSSHDPGEAIMGATDLGTGTGFTAIPWNAAWDAEVQSEVQDAIEANHLDHWIAVADPGGVVANSSFLAKLVSKSATPAFSSFDNTTDSLEAIRDRGDAAWITATGFSTHSAADVWSVATRVLTAGTNIVLPSNALGSITAWTVDITGSLSGSVGSVTSKTGYSLAAAGLDSVVVETGINARQALALIGSSVAGVLDGADSSQVNIYAMDDDQTARIVAAVDADGNRTSVTLTPPA